MLQPIKEAWESYLGMVVPKDAHQSQIDGSRMAFYAGASSVLKMLKIIGEPNVSEEAGIAVVEMMDAECVKYKEDLRRDEGRRFGPSTN